MNLTKQEKEMLQSLTEHPGFAVLQKVEEDAKNRLGRELLKLDWNNKDHIKLLKDNQVYLKAREDFFASIKSASIQIYEDSFKWF